MGRGPGGGRFMLGRGLRMGGGSVFTEAEVLFIEVEKEKL